jgi:hypothetical protein
MKEYKEQQSKVDGVAYPEMEYPDIFGPLSAKQIQIQTIKERFSYKLVPNSVETLFL